MRIRRSLRRKPARTRRSRAAAPKLAEAGQTAHATQAVVSEPVRHAEARAGAEPLTWQPTAAYASPEYWAQAEAEVDGPEIEL